MQYDNRLMFKAYIEVPYTLDIDLRPESDTEDGLVKIFFNDIAGEVCDIIPYGDSFGIPRCWVKQKIDDMKDLSWSEKDSIMSFFDDNNSCDNDDFIIISYDKLFQCTTIVDENGALIFEGDYIKVPDDYETFGFYAGEIYEVFFNAGAFRMKPKQDKYDPMLKRVPRGFVLEDNRTFKIVGNVIEGIKEGK